MGVDPELQVAVLQRSARVWYVIIVHEFERRHVVSSFLTYLNQYG